MHIYLVNEQICLKTTRANFVSIRHLFYLLLAFVLIMDPVLSCGPGGRGYRRTKITGKLRPMVLGEHVPNISEKNIQASGPSIERITRDSPRFKTLEGNYNEYIDFLDPEGTGACRMMTKRLKEKLNILAISVANQWEGVRLTVKRGWTERNDLDPTDLHYEGRAVDIRTSVWNSSHMGLLARLAVEAKFDWVHYERKGYVHCSVKSENNTSGAGCFTGDTIVRTRDGPKALSQVQIGEELLAMNPETGSLEYSPLMLFLDRQPEKEHTYVHIKTSSGQKLKLTPSHLIMRWEKTRTDLSNFTSPFAYNAVPTFAKNIDVNDKLIITRDNKIHLDSVDSVTYSSETGMYAPLTEMGNVVVNDIVASCYAVIDDQNLAHLAFLPYRFVYNINRSFNRFYETVSGLVASSPQSTVSRTHSTPSQEGIHWYAKFLYSIAYYVVPPSMMYEH